MRTTYLATGGGRRRTTVVTEQPSSVQLMRSIRRQAELISSCVEAGHDQTKRTAFKIFACDKHFVHQGPPTQMLEDSAFDDNNWLAETEINAMRTKQCGRISLLY